MVTDPYTVGFTVGILAFLIVPMLYFAFVGHRDQSGSRQDNGQSEDPPTE